jgi:23S rRNA (cytidine1920-2'-O)/16S rRNA (cytidine1409-2'-O)-methyltransferase
MARRTASEAAETRETILREARRLFTDKGFADATLDEVATRAAVTKGAVYHHFADKHDLFAAVFAQLERELDATARTAALQAVSASAGDPRAAFLAGCRAYLDFARRPDFTRIGLVDGPSVMGAGGHALDSALGLPTILATVQGFMAIGRIERRPVKPIALLLFGALNEAAFALARREPEFDETLALDAIARILDGLAPREPGAPGAPPAPGGSSDPPPAPSGGAPSGGAPPRTRRSRLDERLVRDGLADTRTKAQALIRLGRVTVDGAAVDKPGTPVRDTAAVALEGAAERFVSRGGEKLAGALADLGVDPAGKVCLDVGASTGGFTDCLLQAGARRVVAVDVGHGQLDLRLRSDPRVAVLERRNFRTLPAERVREAAGAPIGLATMDVSFISAALLLPALAAAAPGAELLVLVKPQFEVGRGRVGKGGVVRDDALREDAARSVAAAAARLGYERAGQADSRLAGPKGNREIFLLLRPAGR